MIASETVIQPNPRVVYRELADDAGGVLLHLDTGAYHGLSPTGVLIWRLLDEARTFGSLLADFVAQVEGTPPEVDSEIAEFLEELGKRDLVILEGPAAS